MAVMETLPPGVGAVNVSAGGNYIASNNIVLWGPFIRLERAVLKLSGCGPAGVYPVQAFWSVDGVGGSEAAEQTWLYAAQRSSHSQAATAGANAGADAGGRVQSAGGGFHFVQ